MAMAATQAKIQIRRSGERGHFDHGWLDTFHTFSFSDYFDPKHMGFRALRVINEDRVAPGEGFGTHGHKDMEIVTFMIDGELAHKDSMGNGSTIKPGDFQRMSAGTGVRHSEFNASSTKAAHLLQIWVLPEREGLKPGYEQKEFPAAERMGQLRLVVSRDGRAGSMKWNQDANLYSAVLKAGSEIEDRIADGRYGWVQVARGVLTLNGEILSAGDGAAIVSGGAISLGTPIEGDGAEILLFDLP
jgi:redox-sensitive bicupin YhaK (pirin superfamily)